MGRKKFLLKADMKEEFAKCSTGTNRNTHTHTVREGGREGEKERENIPKDI